MKLTRQHFTLIATTLYRQKPPFVAQPDPDAYTEEGAAEYSQALLARQEYLAKHDQWFHTIQSMADAMATTNPNFNRARFVKAAANPED